MCLQRLSQWCCAGHACAEISSSEDVDVDEDVERSHVQHIVKLPMGVADHAHSCTILHRAHLRHLHEITHHCSNHTKHIAQAFMHRCCIVQASPDLYACSHTPILAAASEWWQQSDRYS